MNKWIHIGCGKLGLGLIKDIVSNFNCESIFINRRSEKEYYSKLKEQKGHYFISFPDSTQKELYINFHYYGEEIVRDYFCDKELLFISTSVGINNFTDISNYLIDMLYERFTFLGNKGILFIIACENLSKNSEELKRVILREIANDEINKTFVNFIKDNVIPLNAIVDRICSKVNVENDKVIVYAEKFYQWKVDIFKSRDFFPKFNEIFNSYINLIGLSDPREYEFHEKMKYWLLNGAHLAIAIKAYIMNLHNENTLATLPEAVISSDIQKEIALIINASKTALKYQSKETMNNIISSEEIDKYADAILERIRNGPPDAIERILKDILQLEKIDEQIKDLLNKIEENKNNKDEIKNEIKVFLNIFNITAYINKILERLIEPFEYFCKSIEMIQSKAALNLIKPTFEAIIDLIKQSYALQAHLFEMVEEKIAHI